MPFSFHAETVWNHREHRHGRELRSPSTENRRLIHEPNDSILQVHDVEVDQQTNASLAQLEVGQQLRLMDRMKLQNRFHFDDDFVIDEQVDSISGTDFKSIL